MLYETKNRGKYETGNVGYAYEIWRHGLLASVLPPRASDSASELMQSYCGVEALEHASRTPYHITRVWPKCGESLGPISWWLGGVVTCIRYDVELP